MRKSILKSLRKAGALSLVILLRGHKGRDDFFRISVSVNHVQLGLLVCAICNTLV